jgi:hypothetical protein
LYDEIRQAFAVLLVGSAGATAKAKYKVFYRPAPLGLFPAV